MLGYSESRSATRAGSGSAACTPTTARRSRRRWTPSRRAPPPSSSSSSTASSTATAPTAGCSPARPPCATRAPRVADRRRVHRRHRPPEAQRRLQHDALHDNLTGLPNRVLFLDRLDQSIRRAQRHHPESCAAVLFLDLDRFKIINDILGHPVGDQLLQAVARRLEAALRPNDTVARLSGDEFTLLLDDVREPARRR